MAQVTESDYRIAQESKNSRVRQEFLRDIILPLTEGLVKEIGYCHSLQNVTPYAEFYEWDKRLVIYEDLFKLPLTDFGSIIFDHEVHHARQGWKNLKILSMGYRIGKGVWIKEIPALLNQFSKQRKFDQSHELVKITNAFLIMEEKNMQVNAKEIGRDWKLDLSSDLLPSPYDDIVRERYGL